MTKLFACVGLGKGTWSQLLPIIENEDWEKVIIITNEFGKEKFPDKYVTNYVIINPDIPIVELEKDLRGKLRQHVGFGEVGVSIISGTGKEHTALVAALLKLGAGIKLVAWDEKKVVDF